MVRIVIGLIMLVAGGYGIHNTLYKGASFSEVYTINLAEAPITIGGTTSLEEYKRYLESQEEVPLIKTAGSTLVIELEQQTLTVELNKNTFTIGFNNLSNTACKQLLRRREGKCVNNQGQFSYRVN